MKWFFHDLDQDIRACMHEELVQDVEAGAVFISRAVQPSRVEDYLDAQLDAFIYGSPETLETALLEPGLLRSVKQERVGTDDNFSARALAERQYAVYYLRAVARRAVEFRSQIEVYRAFGSSQTSPSAEERVGEILDAQTLLEDLRDNSTQPDSFERLLEVRGGLLVRIV